MSLIYSCRNNEDDLIKIEKKYEKFMKEWNIKNLVNAKDFLKNIQVFFFDCDGVLWHGDVLMDKAIEVVENLLKEEKKVYFITNNSTKSREKFLEKFHKLGFSFVKKENILCTAYAISKYFHDKEEYTSKKKKIYVIGEKGICDELDSYDLEWVGGFHDNDKKVIIKDDLEVKVDENIGAVVVGMDFNINYYKIQYAQLCINELDAEFIASNKDSTGNFTSKQKWAGTGSIVSCIEAVALKKPKILGKPNLFMIEDILKDLKVDKSKVVMIGDRLDTDINFAKNCKIKSILVSTGVTNSNIYLNHNHLNVEPDYFMKSISELL
ncbi:4-nitrophenylphosphatase, putative [Plasmodium gallinaceum]|uniref:4-nitrophenylphosphatase, putative n=1 Tax=Plasmodium gallinaceum TaxID=5849 RepID=A0A1J1GYT0_PLAGA|nr:4-nitrophenylphosphatase, putative [Plasmodium gallinaceum]CRG97621.1 4-nitrophenylphosphatase, putative [Plasmodium gallinaceum]